MKRIVSAFLAVLLLSFAVPGLFASASVVVYVSEDLSTLTVNDIEYKRFNGLAMNFYFDDAYESLHFPESIKGQIESYEMYSYEQGIAYEIQYFYKDGSILTAYYLHEYYMDDYNELISGKAKNLTVDFRWPEGNEVKTTVDALKGEKTQLKDTEVDNYFTVYAENEDGVLSIEKGTLLICNDDYYYVDHKEAGIPAGDYFIPYNFDYVDAYKITDKALIESFDACMEEYYSDIGVFEDTDLAVNFSAVLLSIVFGILPLAALVFALISLLRRNGRYKKAFAALSVISALELLLFTVLAYIFATAYPKTAASHRVRRLF